MIGNLEVFFLMRWQDFLYIISLVTLLELSIQILHDV